MLSGKQKSTYLSISKAIFRNSCTFWKNQLVHTWHLSSCQYMVTCSYVSSKQNHIHKPVSVVSSPVRSLSRSDRLTRVTSVCYTCISVRRCQSPLTVRFSWSEHGAHLGPPGPSVYDIQGSGIRNQAMKQIARIWLLPCFHWMKIYSRVSSIQYYFHCIIKKVCNI